MEKEKRLSLIEPPTLLLVASNPEGTNSLRIGEEFREIRAGLAQTRCNIRVEQLWATRVRDLRRALLELQPSFLHFAGHGAGEDGLVLEDDQGNPKLVTADPLADLLFLGSLSLRCVVLNACHSHAQVASIAGRVDFAVGMLDEISDRHAVIFSLAFYEAISLGRDVDVAFQLGRNAIALEQGDPTLVVLRGRRVDSSGPSTFFVPASVELYGRSEELQILDQWFRSGEVRLALLLGFGGVGKTGVAAKFGRRGIGKSALAASFGQQATVLFDIVVWQSLINAPPLSESLKEVLAVLDSRTRDPVSGRIGPLDLLARMKGRRVLLVLDNFESVLDPDNPTDFRPGYEDYGELLLLLGSAQNESATILTSREKPLCIEQLEGANRPIRTLTIRGLDSYNGRLLCEEIADLVGSDEDWRDLVEFFDGNPLALELVSRRIASAYGGSIRGFLDDSGPIVEGIESLLDWHVSRLSEQELEVLYWLAIDREPATLDDLRSNLLSATRRFALAGTIETLQRHLPLEKRRLRVGVQPVLLEYLTKHFVSRIGNEIQLKPGWSANRVTGHLTERIGKELALGDTRSLFTRFSISKATSKSFVRLAQRRNIVRPLLERICKGSQDCTAGLFSVLDELRGDPPVPGYAAGNVVSLLVEAGADLSDSDLSHLEIRQVDFQDVDLLRASLRNSRLQQVRFRSDFSHLLCVAISSDGRFLAAGDTGGRVHIWNFRNQHPVGTLVGHNGWVRTVSFSEDGELVASGSEDCDIRIWRTADLVCEAVLQGHSHWVNDIAFLPAGSHTLSAGQDGHVRIWDWRKGRNQIVTTCKGSHARRIAVVESGSRILVGDSAGCVSLIDLESGCELHRATAHTDWVSAIEASEDESLYISGSFDGSIRVAQLDTGNEISRLHGHSDWIWDLALSPDGTHVASVGRDKALRFWSLRVEKCQWQASPAHEGSIRAVAFSPNGDQLVTVGQDQALRIWETHDGREVGILRGHATGIWSLCAGRDDREFLSGGDEGVVRVWDPQTRKSGGRISLKSAASGRIWSIACQSGTIAAGGVDKAVHVGDESGTGVLRIGSHEDWVLAVALSSDGRKVVSGGSNRDPVIRIWSTRSGGLLGTLRGHTDRIHGIGFGARDDIIVSSSDDGTLRVWDTGSCLQTWLVETSHCWKAFKLSPFCLCQNQHLVGVLSAANRVSIFDFSSRSRTSEIISESGNVLALAIDRNGNHVALLTEDSRIEIWEPSQSNPDISVFLPGREYLSLAYSRDDKVLCVGTAQGQVEFWDSSTGELIGSGETPRPYQGLVLEGTTGLTSGQKRVLYSLGAV